MDKKLEKRVRDVVIGKVLKDYITLENIESALMDFR